MSLAAADTKHLHFSRYYCWMAPLSPQGKASAYPGDRCLATISSSDWGWDSCRILKLWNKYKFFQHPVYDWVADRHLQIQRERDRNSWLNLLQWTEFLIQSVHILANVLFLEYSVPSFAGRLEDLEKENSLNIFCLLWPPNLGGQICCILMQIPAEPLKVCLIILLFFSQNYSSPTVHWKSQEKELDAKQIFKQEAWDGKKQWC